MKNAFTLAEVLVTVGIIGVVAAMTVPNLMENYQRQSYITQLRKVYSELSQAAEHAMSDSHSPRLYETIAMRNGRVNFLQTYFKINQTCDANNLTDCFADSYTTIGGEAYRLKDLVSTESACGVVASGYTICLNGHFAALDINGKQGPNVLGRDLFGFFLNNDGSITSGMDPSTSTTESCVGGGYDACFAKILNDGWVMDY